MQNKLSPAMQTLLCELEQKGQTMMRLKRIANSNTSISRVIPANCSIGWSKAAG